MFFAYVSDCISVNKGEVSGITKNIFALARVNPDTLYSRFMMMD